MSRRFAGLATAAALQLIALVLAHELVFLARYGSRYGEALAHAGHGTAWIDAVLSSLALAALLGAAAAFRLTRLGLLLRRQGTEMAAPGTGTLAPASLLRDWLRVAPRMALVSVVLLSIQETLERAAIGAPVPGPTILLTPEYAGGLWITIAVALGVALLAALFRWRRDVLLARLRAVRLRLSGRPERAVVRPGARTVAPTGSLLGRKSALRAPPLATAT